MTDAPLHPTRLCFLGNIWALGDGVEYENIKSTSDPLQRGEKRCARGSTWRNWGLHYTLHIQISDLLVSGCNFGETVWAERVASVGDV